MTKHEARQIEINKGKVLLKYWKQEIDKNFAELKADFSKEALDEYIFATDKYNSIKAKYDKCEQFPLETAVELYNWMSCKLKTEFNAVCDDNEGIIRFKWFGRSHGFIICMLASYFNIKACGFRFELELTDYEAQTSDGYRFHIGIDPEDTGAIIIDFHFKTAGDISWL